MVRADCVRFCAAILMVAVTLATSGCKDTAFGGVSPPSNGTRDTNPNSRQNANGGHEVSVPRNVDRNIDRNGDQANPATDMPPGGMSSIRAPEDKTSPIQSILSNLGTTLGTIVAHGHQSPGSDAGSAGGPGQSGATPPGDQTVTLIQPGPPPCSESHFVPATANPYMAGVAAGTTITYDLAGGGGPDPVDRSPKHNPVQARVIGDCFGPGKSLIFRVSGMITYDPKVAAINANGRANQIVTHQKAGLYGKSDISAPFCSLLAVFLDDNDPSSQTAPGPLSFTTPQARDYESLSPGLGQVFFIGTGLRSNGEFHRVVVPPRATRLYFAVMDTYQWNNNLGGVRVQMFGINP